MSENINVQNHDVAVKNAEKTEKSPVKIRVCQIQPDADIAESKEDFILTMDMAGVDTKDIDIKLDKDILTINAKSSIEGLAPRQYYRQFRVMRGLDASACRADYKLGVLTLKLAKPSTAKPQQIPITCD
jgi:HSP20 family protein